MRVLGEIPHPVYKITLFGWNGKYILKIEDGMLEQTYKIPEFEVIDEKEVIKLLDETFLNEVSERFSSMNISINEALERINTF